MTQGVRRLPYFFVRGGTSKGCFFLKQHLPYTDEELSGLLLNVMGTVPTFKVQDTAIDPSIVKTDFTNALKAEYGCTLKDCNIDEHAHLDIKQVCGIGGTTSITNKVAILSKSETEGVDVDFRFAQVNHTSPSVDFAPSCGNIMSAVAQVAIEMGLVDEEKIRNGTTSVIIHAVNNHTRAEATIQTLRKGDDYEVCYEGNASIDGVGGTAAPVTLKFMNVVGSESKGKLLPTGNVRDVFNGLEVTCIDVSMPMVIAKASAFGKTGRETTAELDADAEFFKRLEAVRMLAGEKMGYGDVTGKVLPTFAIVAEPTKETTNILARYFTPGSTHASMAVTGAICIGSCCILKGSVADDVSRKTNEEGKQKVVIEHPSGAIQVTLESEQLEGEVGLTVRSADILRTAKLIAEGFLRVPSHWWHGDKQDEQRIYKVHRCFRELFVADESSDGKKPSADGTSHVNWAM